jgi:hypothetical protein
MSTLLYRQHAQHTVIIDTMHTMHIEDLLSGNEWIHNNINGLNVLNARETPKMGFRGPEVQILSPRPISNNKYRELATMLIPFFVWETGKSYQICTNLKYHRA